MARALAACVALAFAMSASAQSGHEAMGDVPGNAKIEHRDYEFAVTAPSAIYEDIGWKRYRDRSDPGSTILVTGMSGYDSYALSVTTVAAASPPADPAKLGKERYPEMAFVPHPENTACAVTDTKAAPAAIGRGMVAFVAECVDATTGRAYELVVSWKSLLLRTEAIDAARAAGVSDGRESQPRAEFRAAMDRFVASFRFR